MGGPKCLKSFKNLVKSNLEMVKNGDLSVNDFVRKTRPVIERHEFESSNMVRENMKNLRNTSSNMQQHKTTKNA